LALSSEEVRFRYNVFCSTSGSGAIVRGGKSVWGNLGNPDGQPHQDERNQLEDEKLLGWESPTYGDLRPTVSLVYTVQAPLPIRIVTVILTDEALLLQQREHELILSSAGSEVHRISLSPQQTLKRSV
jgi:hypothetical protein